MVRAIHHQASDKGERVEILGGTYRGLLGWVHLTANTFPDKQWVILEAGRTASGRAHPDEKPHLLKKANVGSTVREVDEEMPRTFECALLKEHPDIRHDMQNLAKKLSTFVDYHPRGGKDMMKMLWLMWVEEKRKVRQSNRVPNARVVVSWLSNPNNVQPPVQEVATGSNMSTDSLNPPDFDDFDGNFISDDEEGAPRMAILARHTALTALARTRGEPNSNRRREN